MQEPYVCTELRRECGRHRQLFAWFRPVLLKLFAGAMLLMSGCGELEPMIEPEVQDLQLTVDTLKTQIRDNQRVLAELRAELESRRQELADAQVAKAQLEGRVREAERRVAEARQVINLQREELAAARTERERISRSSAQLQSQMRKLQRHMPKARGMEEGDHTIAPASTGGASRKAPRASAVPMATDSETVSSIPQETVMATPAAMVAPPPSRSVFPEVEHHDTPVRTISVKLGDTLWSIAQKYHVDLHRLRTLNHLTDNRILVGQAIWVPMAQAEGAQNLEVAP